MKKRFAVSFKSLTALVLGIALMGHVLAIGCGKSPVPNSDPDDIESAKFDAEKAENPNPMGASIPPD